MSKKSYMEVCVTVEDGSYQDLWNLTRWGFRKSP